VNVRDVFELLVQEIYNVKSREQPKKPEGGRVLIHNDPSLLENGGASSGSCCGGN
jgi:hypothetical protein